MGANPLLKLEKLGQSIWMDFISRGSISSGELQHWVDEDGVSGVTSNPSIFGKAIGGNHDYDDTIRSLAQQNKPAIEIFQSLAVEDIQNATQIFKPTYDRLNGRDGFVSLEVSPLIANDTQASIAEARKLWSAVSRPNVMIKIPGTKEGLPAIRQMISEGVNINITLLFGLPRYREVIESYLSGLEAREAQGEPINHIASVASFFLSRIDTLVDPILEKLMKEGGEKAVLAEKAHGQVAIASARAAYEIYQEAFSSPRFRRLERNGARPQRLLWASTSTKNPAYIDVKYVEALIGPDTINTVPVETLDAYRDHGNPALHLTDDLPQAHAVLDSLAVLGIQIDQVTQQLEDEGTKKFDDAFNQLMTTIEQKRLATLAETVHRP